MGPRRRRRRPRGVGDRAGRPRGGPVPAGAAARPRRLPPRQVLRRRHRAARARRPGHRGRRGRGGRLDPAARPRALARRRAGRRGDGAPGVRRPACGPRRPPRRARRRRRGDAAPPPGLLGHARRRLRSGPRLGRARRGSGGRRRRRALPRPHGPPGRDPRPPRHRHPRLRPDHASAPRTTGDPVRRAPPAVVRLGLRPRRRTGQRRVRRAAADGRRPPRAAQPAAAARAARGADTRRRRRRHRLARAPPAAQQLALAPARRPRAAGGGRGGAGQPDDGGGHLLRGRDRDHRRAHRGPDRARRPSGRTPAPRTAATCGGCWPPTCGTPGSPRGWPARRAWWTRASGPPGGTGTPSTRSSSSVSATAGSHLGSRPGCSAGSSDADRPTAGPPSRTRAPAHLRSSPARPRAFACAPAQLRAGPPSLSCAPAQLSGEAAVSALCTCTAMASGQVG